MLRRVLTFLGYFGSTVLVIGVTAGLVAYGKDYTYDFATHTIVQKGHVIINSLPTGVRVSEGGRDLNKKTPYQAAYHVGEHTFMLNKDGFWPWQKTVSVVAGQVNLLRYAILVPRAPQKKVLATHEQIVTQHLSRDHRRLVYITGGKEAAVYALDIAGAKVVKVYTPKPAEPPQGAEVLVDAVLSNDGSHVLIRSAVDGHTVYRLGNAGGGEPQNLTQRYGFEFSALAFSTSKWQQLYWLSPEGLRRLDVEAQTVSAVLAEHVTQFWAESDRVLYVQQTDLGRSLWSLDGRGNHQELIPALVESDTYSLDYEQYRGKDELVVVPAKTGAATLYSNILSATPVAQVVAHDVLSAEFSPEGQYVVLSSPGAISTYDLERSAFTSSIVVYDFQDLPGQLTGLSWFDDFHLLRTHQGRLYWSEFDGANRTDLGAVAGGFAAYGTADEKSVVAFVPSTKGTQIVQLQIKQ
jgi:hypothetical protein